MGRILLRYGELALKGRNRVYFVRQLRRNVRAALRAHDIEGQVYSAGQRVYVETDRVDDAIEPLSRVFGLVSLSAVITVPRDMDAIAAECVRQARKAGVGPKVSFRVQARRADKSFPYTSPEINRLAGEAIVSELDGKVDLSNNTDVTIGVEVARDEVLVFGNVIKAPGGLPLGTGGRAIALISGGIDSPAAAWMMMKRGCQIIPVHFAQNEVEKQKALDNIRVLARYSYGWNLRPILLSHEETIAPTLEKLYVLGEERWACVFCKRSLLLRAAALAEEMGAQAVIMGDALGQVASQTLANMEVISHGVPKPILRPLIGLDKDEIVEIARRIGTFEISTRHAESCPFLPNSPVTRGSVAKLLDIIRRMDETGE